MLSVRRQFHTSKWTQFKQKAAGKVKKTKVPNKTKDVEHRSFREAVSYSAFQRAATPVPGLEVLADQRTQGIFALPENVAASLTHLGSFPPQQNSELFNQRASLWRQQTFDLVDNLQGSHILSGPGGVGKSTVLSQIQAAAKAKGWALVHIPRAMELIDGSSDYIQAGDKWLQPMYTKRLFSRIEKANRDTLGSDALAVLKSRDPAALEELFATISKSQKVLLSVDGINAWSAKPYSEYRTKANEPIYHGDLYIPKTILAHFKGGLNGAVVAATTGLYPTNATFSGTSHSYASIDEYDPQLAQTLSAASTHIVPYLNLAETRLWLEYLQKAGVAPAELDEAAVQTAFTTSAGNPRNLLRSFINYSF